MPFEPTHSFRLFLNAQGRGPFYQCLIFNSTADMRRAGARLSRQYGKPNAWKGAMGITIHFPPAKGMLSVGTGAHVGSVLLCRKHMGIGLISHEMTHAAFYVEGDADERLAWLQGWLMSQFFSHLKTNG